MSLMLDFAVGEDVLDRMHNANVRGFTRLSVRFTP
jgi:hypothetical protein